LYFVDHLRNSMFVGFTLQSPCKEQDTRQANTNDDPEQEKPRLIGCKQGRE